MYKPMWWGTISLTYRDSNVIYLRKATGTIPARYWAILRKAGSAISKCGRGGLHHPPLSLGKAKLGGQKLVAVTMMEPGRHHLGSSSHRSSKQAPQLKPLLNNAVLSAAVLVPYPWLYKFPYPQAPPALCMHVNVNYINPKPKIIKY